MNDIKKYVTQAIIVAGFGVLSWWVGTIWSDTKTNTNFSIKHTKDLETLQSRVTIVEDNVVKISNDYVTRRELDIRLQNIDSKIDNINKDVNSASKGIEKLNDKIDRILERVR